MKPVRTHTFNKHKYGIYTGPLKGVTDIGTRPSLSMLIRTSGVSERTILNVTVHEALHACDWDKSEKKVDRTANDISRFLWRLGYRIEKQ